MSRPARLISALILIAAGCLASALPVQAAQHLVQKHVPSITRKLASAGRLESGASLDLAIGLPLRNREQLTNLLHDVYDRSSPNYRHFLTPEEFAASFGPSQEDYQAVIDFAKAHGLIVKRTHANRTLVDVTGSVGDIEKAFHVHMHVFKHPLEARDFFAPDAEPTLDLATPILAISGLDNYVKPHPRVHANLHPLGGGSGGGGGGGGGGDGAGSGSGLFGYYGYDFQAAYTPQTLLDGTGQSVGLFELSGYSQADIASYVDETGLPGVPLQNVLVDGFDGGDGNEDFAIECTSDIEMAIAMAPGLSSVIVYEGPTPENEPPAIQLASTTAQINDVFNAMATNVLARQLSCSYAMDINLSTLQIFQQFAAQGQSLFQASGDFGAFSGAVDEPADDPYITIVGGTTLRVNSDSTYFSETVWLTPAGTDPIFGVPTPLEATGGGISRTYGIPVWQQGISMTANQGSTTMRNLPDVASVADGIDIIYGNDDENIGFPFDLPVSGTSLAAPLWAAFTALVNQQAAENGQPPVGFINPALYALGKSTNYTTCFHDITTGNNFTPKSPTKFSAVAGYDLCTGWGTPNDPLIDALLAPPTESLVVTPPFGFIATGPGGGPFSKTTQTYTLTNIGVQPLNWSLGNSANWLTASKTSGTLASGAGTTVTVSLNSAANNFLIKYASGNVTFNNLTAGTFQNRQFDLYVGNGGFEDGDYTYWNLVGDSTSTIVLAADDVDVAGSNALPGQPDELFVHSGLYGGYLGELPPDGMLSQTVATTAGQQYAISFWLTCVPEQNGTATPNHFAAKWNGVTIYNNTNLPAFGWTNLQFVLPATAAAATLEFDFNDQPGAFGLDDVTVESSPGIMQSVALASGSNLMISWPLSAATFQLQSSSNLLSSNSWVTITPVLSTNGSVISAPVPISGGQQYFRLKQ